jgi:xanthine dehydrogenase accessory factor
MHGPIYQQLHRSLEEDRLAALATIVEGPGVGKQVLLYPSGERVGGLENPALEEAVADAAETVFRSFGTERVEADGSVVFVEAHPPAPKLVIVGAVHTAISLVTFANELGFRTYVVDPRSVFATPERFAHATELIREWPQDALPRIGLNEGTFVAVLSHDDKFDVPALEIVLRHPVRYVGALGSKKTHARRVKTLKERGISDEALARIHSPIGIDLGGRRPEEIAVSIVAEMVREGHGGA